MFKAVAFAALTAIVRADTPAPDSLQAHWVGNIAQSFGNANPNVAGSYECLANNETITATDATLDITTWAVNVSATNSVAKTAANHAVYIMDPRQAITYAFANFDKTGSTGNDGILMIRDPVNATAPAGTLGNIECKYGVVTGTGSGRQLTVVTLGGYTWQEQCNIATYQNIPNIATQPFCTTNGVDMIPRTSSVVETYAVGHAPDGGNNDGGNTGSSGAATNGFAAAVAALAAGAAYILL